ncbi:uncharacterized protein V6R79_020775 [Siganus canaliculatus]
MSGINEMDGEVDERRAIKLTSKAMAFKIEALQRERQTNIRKLKGCIREIKVLMEKDENAKAVQSKLDTLTPLYESAQASHFSVLPLLPNEVQDAQDDWFRRITKCNNDFMDDVKQWLLETGRSSVETGRVFLPATTSAQPTHVSSDALNDEVPHKEVEPVPCSGSNVNATADMDEVQPEDSVSNSPHKVFPKEYIPCFYQTYNTQVHVDGQTVDLNLEDSAGREEYDSIRPICYNSVNVIVICFSIADPTSFENIKRKWHPEVKHYCSNVPILLLGTKSDLRDDQDVVEKLRALNQTLVSQQQGKVMTNQIKAVKYLECASMNLDGLDEVFDEAVRAVLSHSTKKLCILL